MPVHGAGNLKVNLYRMCIMIPVLYALCISDGKHCIIWFCWSESRAVIGCCTGIADALESSCCLSQSQKLCGDFAVKGSSVAIELRLVSPMFYGTKH